MQTRVVSTLNTSLDEIVEQADRVLSNGGLVAFPTETVYGLGGNALDPDASKKIYEAKGRPSDNPLIVHVGRTEDVYPLVRGFSDTAKQLTDRFWPGPLTIILPKSDVIPDQTTGGLKTVAIRMPSHPVARALLLQLSFPVAAPSANRSGRPSTTSASHVIEDLSGRVDMIIDDGDVPIGVESTIVDLTGETPVLLRPGYVTKEALEEVIGHVDVDPAIDNRNLITHEIAVNHPKAPGMKYRHYAPKAPLTVLSGSPKDVASFVNAFAGVSTGVLCTDETKDLYQKGLILSVGSRQNPESIAHALFDMLRRFDEQNVTEIYAEDLSEADIGTAIMNRLLKAAGGNFITV